MSAPPAALSTEEDRRSRLADARLASRGVAGVTITALSAILLYLVYAWAAFDVSNLLAKADPQRAVLLGLDSVAYKTHVTKNLRRDTVSVAIEGERSSTYDAFPDWVAEQDGIVTVDLDDGYRAVIEGSSVTLSVPDYGDIVATATDDGIDVVLPGPRPDWVRTIDPRKFDARPTLYRRVQITRTKIEVHRYVTGWENFWFDFASPLRGLDVFDAAARAASDEPIPGSACQERQHVWTWIGAGPLAIQLSLLRFDTPVWLCNASFAWSEFLRNQDWQHGEVFKALWETILMAVLGTFVAAFVGLPLAFLAARNFTPFLLLRLGVRRIFDFLRGVDSLIWSLIFIRAFGLGPLTGALAIAFTDTGTLGKLFSEALENIDDKQVEGVRATGANQVQRYRFGVIPQILPVFISQSLYYLESNTRSATVIGALGAGGIGLLLVQAINTSRDWENVQYIIVLTFLVVVVMDVVSGWLRRRLISG